MLTRVLLLISPLLGCGWCFKMSDPIGMGKSCGLTYGSVLTKQSWVCEDIQYTTYPGEKIDALLADTAMYGEIAEYLRVTRGCHTYNDHTDIHGTNEYYEYETLCKTVRKPVRVIWATVPDYVLPPEQKSINGGLLPCHVLEGQHLYDVECMHPWADGIPPHYPPKRASRLRVPVGVAKKMCLSGYGYNRNMVCKPTGFIQREIIVYSEHANVIFSVIIPDVPTSCSCVICKCNVNKG